MANTQEIPEGMKVISSYAEFREFQKTCPDGTTCNVDAYALNTGEEVDPPVPVRTPCGERPPRQRNQ